MDILTIALFGEAEKGDYQTPYFCETLPQLVDNLGNPPIDSRGLFFAIQAVLYHRNILFIRVREEGFSHQDYFHGIQMLENAQHVNQVSAVCLPGVGDREILHAITPFCKTHHSVLITTEPDLYDYLTHLKI